MFEMFDELGIFGDVMLPVEKEKKQKPKKTEKKEPEKKVVETKYNLPLKVVFDSIEPIEIEGEGEITKSDLVAKIVEKTDYKTFKEHEKYFQINKLDDTTYLYRPVYSSKCDKGDSGKFLLLSRIQVLEEIIEAEEECISVEAVKKYVLENYGIKVDLHLVEEVYIPVPVNASSDSIENARFPLKVTALTLFGEQLEITQDDYLAFENQKEEQLSLIEDEEEKNQTVSDEVIKKVIKTLLPEYEKDLIYYYNSERNLICVLHKTNSAAPQTAAKVKEEELYPTDATVSLIFTKINLSSGMFDGKKEITKKEVLKYISKQYPEYSPERTEILYDKKRKLIIPSLKSGKRGSYCLKDEEGFRYEKSPIMEITAIKEERDFNGCVKGYVNFKLPKIPFEVLEQTVEFFMDVYRDKGTEAIAQIFYNRNSNQYEIYIPKQMATSGYVKFERNLSLELHVSKYLVMEIHSHARFGAFWSKTDNEDEVFHRLYAVVGSLDTFKYDKEHMIVRAATGGLQVKLRIEDVFCLKRN